MRFLTFTFIPAAATLATLATITTAARAIYVIPIRNATLCHNLSQKKKPNRITNLKRMSSSLNASKSAAAAPSNSIFLSCHVFRRQQIVLKSILLFFWMMKLTAMEKISCLYAVLVFYVGIHSKTKTERCTPETHRSSD